MEKTKVSIDVELFTEEHYQPNIRSEVYCYESENFGSRFFHSPNQLAEGLVYLTLGNVDIDFKFYQISEHENGSISRVYMEQDDPLVVVKRRFSDVELSTVVSNFANYLGSEGFREIVENDLKNPEFKY